MGATSTDAENDARLDITQLALDRTWLAHERTLMAWVRTATSMIGFGFTIYKFFQLDALHKGTQQYGITPRHFALMMVSIGLITLLLATISRRVETKNISKQLKRSPGSMAEIVAGLVFAFGILVLVATTLRG